MGTLQENQSLNAEYERNKKEREMQEDIEYLNYCNEQLEKTNKNLNYKVEKLEEDYRITCEQKNQYISTLEQGLNNAEQEIERLTISLQAQEELTMNWYNKVKKARDLFYEKCRISQNGAYIFNEVDYEELSNILGGDKE